MNGEAPSSQFDSALAMQYGYLINATYTMATDQNNLTPSPQNLPPGFKFIAWIQMKDFILDSSTWRFYGMIVQRMDTPDKFVLVIRGTEPTNLEEWIDDLSSIAMVPLPEFGNVGYGFDRIFGTMRVIENGETTPATIFEDVAKALKPFTQQVAETVGKHGAASPLSGTDLQAKAAGANSIEVTGHSLGSALATLYVAKNANAKLLPVSRLYTFASPLVGDAGFVSAFEDLDIVSWRIANILDVVTHVPVIGFKHIDKVQQFNSGYLVNRTATCLHSMMTYLHLVHPAFPLDKGCEWDGSAPGPQIAGHTS